MRAAILQHRISCVAAYGASDCLPLYTQGFHPGLGSFAPAALDDQRMNSVLGNEEPRLDQLRERWNKDSERRRRGTKMSVLLVLSTEAPSTADAALTSVNLR